MGRSVRAQAHRNSHFQKLRRIRHCLAAVAEGTVAGLYAPLHHQGFFLLGKYQAVSAQEIASQHMHFLQILIGPHSLPVHDAVDFPHVLVHMGLKHGAPLPGPHSFQLHKTAGTGIQGPERIIHLKVSLSVEPVIEGIRTL